MKINLTQQETMTLLACAYNQLDDLNELKSKNKLSIGWKIMFDDFNSAIKKLDKQYRHQLNDDFSHKMKKKWTGLPPFATNSIVNMKTGLDIMSIPHFYPLSHSLAHFRTKVQGDTKVNHALDWKI